jgi:predicted nuclease of predicted toxin-antitoxin system
MARFIIDANLPYYFGLWNNSDYIHVFDINDTWSDLQIWNYAKQNNLIIVTKDADFSLKALIEGTPPKVIHIRFGNLKMREFHEKISTIWEEVNNLIDNNNMISIYIDKIELIK